MVAIAKKNNTLELIKKLEKKKFSFPAKNGAQLFLFIRQWLEEQDIFINIRRAASITPCYLYIIDLGARKEQSTMKDACTSSKDALEHAILRVLDMDVFPK